MYDLIIRNGTVIDGTRAPAYKADVCVKDGRIAAIEPGVQAEAAKVVDATGKIVAPGFLDIHSHSDVAPLAPFDVETKQQQGVTFELCGNCGISILPATAESREALTDYFLANLQFPTEGMRITCLDTPDYARDVAANGAAANYGMLVGHSALRCAVMGFDNRAPAADEQKAMEELLDAELTKGAFGMSLGLIYPPSAFAEKEELIGLAKVFKKHDAILAVHIRNEGPRVFQSVEEMLDIGEKSGAHIHISHLKIMTKSLWGQSQKLLDMIDGARERGVNVTCDQYPYHASSTSMTAMVPKWAHAGGFGEMLKRLASPEQRLLDDIATEMESRGGADRVMVASTHYYHPEWEGRMLDDIARELGLSPVEAVVKILIDCNVGVNCNYFSQSEEDVERIISRADICVGSDGYNFSLDPTITRDTPHPRSFGTFPRALQILREKNLLSLEDAVYKMTGRPAEVMGMTERGTLAVGKVADITVFDPETVGQTPDFMNTLRAPEGIEYVFVAGELVLADKKLTGAKPGKVLLRGQC